MARISGINIPLNKRVEVGLTYIYGIGRSSSNTILAQAGITPDKWVAFYCGTGWRASETWFYAYLQGWDRIAVYDGGWFEWSQDPVNNPIEIGDPEEAAPQDDYAA